MMRSKVTPGVARFRPRILSRIAPAALALALLALVVGGSGCGTTAPVEVGEARSGGDRGAPATINTKLFKVTGVEEGDTVMFYPSEGRQRKAVANTVVFRFYEMQSVEDDHTSRRQLTIRKAISFDKTEIFRRDHLIDIGDYDPDKRVNGAVRYTVTNIGSEPVPTFLIVDKLPQGFEVEEGGSLRVLGGETTAAWELDASGRVIIREGTPLLAKHSRRYLLPLRIAIRPGASE